MTIATFDPLLEPLTLDDDDDDEDEDDDEEEDELVVSSLELGSQPSTIIRKKNNIDFGK